MPQIQVQEKSPSETCPLCRAALGQSQRVVTCDSCATIYHAECGAEFGSGCPTAGCSALKVSSRRSGRRTVFAGEPARRVRSELGSLLLLALGLFGAMVSGMLLVVETSLLWEARGGLALSVMLVSAGWFLNPSRDRG